MSRNEKGEANTSPKKPYQTIIDINVSSSVILQSEIIPFDAKMLAAKAQPAQRQYCGNYIYENELTLLFAPTSYGKSVLAMTLAIGIASGTSYIIDEVNEVKEPQKVLYLDFEMSDQQLRNRYENLPSIPNLYSLNLEQLLNRKQGNFQVTESDLCEWIDTVGAKVTDPNNNNPSLNVLDEKSTAKVLILDNMGAVLSDSQNHVQAMELIFMLHRLTRQKGITIILISHATKGVFSGAKTPIHIGNSEGSYKLTAYCDHVLGLGKTPEDELYLRHLKSRNGQDQSVGKIITIKNDPYIFAESSETVPLSELFQSENNESAGRGRKPTIDYSAIAKELFSENLQMSHSDMVRTLEFKNLASNPSTAKNYIKKLIECDLVFKDNDSERYSLKQTNININQQIEEAF